MYNTLLIIQYISILFLLVETGYIFAKWRTTLHGYLFFNCAATLVNNTGYLMEMQAHTQEAYMMGLQMSYLGRVWIPFSLLLFVLALCKIKANKGTIAVLCLIHTVTFLLVLTSQWQPFYYSSMEYVHDGLFPYIKCSSGIWHSFYSALLIAYIVFGITKMLKAFRKEKNIAARKRLLCILVAVAVESGFYIVQLTGITGSYDITVLGYSISTIFMYIAIFKYDLLNMLQLAKDYVIDEVVEGIIAVNTAGHVEYYNKPAMMIFPELKNHSSSIIEDLKISVEKKAPVEISGRIYSPQVKTLYQNDDVTGEVYVLVDDTEHYLYMKELEEQKNIAEAANASKSAFLSVVSHEIRTPMNAVVGMTDLLLQNKGTLDSKQAKYLTNIRNSGEALVMIVNDILDQSKIEAGRMELVEDVYEIRSIVDDVKLIIDNRIGSKPVHLISEIDDNVPHLLIGDGLRIRQILINLMNNAVKFTEEGFIQLTIRCTDEDEGKMLIRFGVKDSGQGIKAEDLDKLGQAFTQVDTRRNHGKEGTGLGLSISRDFISMMGGQLEVTSEYGKGSEFYFSIWQNIAEGAGRSAMEIHYDAEFTAPEAKALVVDDTEINLMIAEELLASLKIAVDTAVSGEKAVDMVKKNRYDIIFMDYMMPYMNGVETTELIRGMAASAVAGGDEDSAEYFRTVPIVALTGDTSDETKEKFLRAGIDDFTEKPMDIKRLKKLLLKWLSPDHIRS